VYTIVVISSQEQSHGGGLPDALRIENVVQGRWQEKVANDAARGVADMVWR
jgi:hypothetical protein